MGGIFAQRFYHILPAWRFAPNWQLTQSDYNDYNGLKNLQKMPEIKILQITLGRLTCLFLGAPKLEACWSDMT